MVKWCIFDETLFLAHKIVMKMAVTVIFEDAKLIQVVFFAYNQLAMDMSEVRHS